MIVATHGPVDATGHCWWDTTVSCDTGCGRAITFNTRAKDDMAVVIGLRREQLAVEGWTTSPAPAPDPRIKDWCRSCSLTAAGWQGQRPEQEGITQPGGWCLPPGVEPPPPPTAPADPLAPTPGEPPIERLVRLRREYSDALAPVAQWNQYLRQLSLAIADAERTLAIAIDRDGGGSYYDTFNTDQPPGDGWIQGTPGAKISTHHYGEHDRNGGHVLIDIGPGDISPRYQCQLCGRMDPTDECDERYATQWEPDPDHAVDPCRVCGGAGDRCRARWVTNGGPGIKCCPDCTHAAAPAG